MPEALPALVLNLEAPSRSAMNETPTNQAKVAGNVRSASAASDEQLMLAFSKGSSDAFTELFLRYKQPIYGFFRRRISESAQAEELTQEAFVALLRAAARYEPRALFRAYLYAIGFKGSSRPSSQAAFRATFSSIPLGTFPGLRTLQE
jgi:Sigma-70 region 2